MSIALVDHLSIPFAGSPCLSPMKPRDCAPYYPLPEGNGQRRHPCAGCGPCPEVYGGVTWVETKKDVLWHVEGKDIDGRSIQLVIAADEAEPSVKLVNAMILPD
jgi:hypothetical protein